MAKNKIIRDTTILVIKLPRINEIGNKKNKKLKALKEVALYSKIIEERVIIASDDKNDIVTLKGVDESFQSVTSIDSVIVQGGWFAQEANQVVVGWGVSNTLSLGVLDYSKVLTIYVPKPGKGQITSTNNAFNSIRAINVGVFDINEKINDTYVYGSLDLAQHLLNYDKNQITGDSIYLKSDIIIINNI